MILGFDHSPPAILADIWKELRRGVVDRKHPFRLMTLATIREQVPVQRMVVNRKIDEQQRFLIYTDRRSGKLSDLAQNDRASLLFYHPKRQLQISIDCKLSEWMDAEQRRTIWNAFGEHSKKDYNRLKEPGAVLSTPEETRLHAAGEGFDNFCLLRCTPLAMDILQLSREGHRRLRFHHDPPNGWNGSWIAP